jgi:hypothetical protein
VLFAEHPRSYGRNQDIENPDHLSRLVEERKRADDAALLARFLTLSPKAEAYYRRCASTRTSRHGSRWPDPPVSGYPRSGRRRSSSRGSRRAGRLRLRLPQQYPHPPPRSSSDALFRLCSARCSSRTLRPPILLLIGGV